MIVLEVRRVFRKENGQELCHRSKIIQKWANDYDFGFDIFEPRNWRKFLMSHRIDGKLLPRTSNDGEYFVYQVRVFGAERWMKEALGLEGSNTGTIYTLFPEKDPETGKTLKLRPYGRIDI